MCVYFISCGATQALSGETDQATAVANCITSTRNRYVGNQALDELLTHDYFPDLGYRHGEDFLYNQGLGMSDEILHDARMSAAYSFVNECYMYGYCHCTQQTQYLQPAGLTDGAWGMETYCGTCPDGGMAYSELMINKCRQFANTEFSDVTGRGLYNGECYYQAD